MSPRAEPPAAAARSRSRTARAESPRIRASRPATSRRSGSSGNRASIDAKALDSFSRGIRSPRATSRRVARVRAVGFVGSRVSAAARCRHADSTCDSPSSEPADARTGNRARCIATNSVARSASDCAEWLRVARSSSSRRRRSSAPRPCPAWVVPEACAPRLGIVGGPRRAIAINASPHRSVVTGGIVEAQTPFRFRLVFGPPTTATTGQCPVVAITFDNVLSRMKTFVYSPNPTFGSSAQ